MPEQSAEQELTWQQQRMLNDMVSSNERSSWKAYTLAFFLGGFGVHRFYLGHKWTAITILVLNLLGVSIYQTGAMPPESVPWEMVGFAMVITGFAWIIVDLFLIPGMVRKFNAGLEPELKKKLLKEWTT